MQSTNNWQENTISFMLEEDLTFKINQNAQSKKKCWNMQLHLKCRSQHVIQINTLIITV